MLGDGLHVNPTELCTLQVIWVWIQAGRDGKGEEADDGREVQEEVEPPFF